VRSSARGALHLWGDFSLADPAFLVLLPVALVALLWGRSRQGRARGLVPLVAAAPGGGPVLRSLRQRLGWVPLVLQALALVCVIVGLARPLRGNVQNDIVTEGVDIALVVDRSSSMRFDDLQRGSDRLTVVKEVVGEFAQRRMTDREGASDNCALITFARYPRLLCPFTLDVDALTGLLDGVEMARFQEEDGTAIGVALAKAVSVLRETDSQSKVCVLLTDGENNVFDISPDQAAELAAEEGIRVYTIYSARYLYRRDAFRGWLPSEQGFDTTELERIAELTGGRFYHARDRDNLEEIYAEIEELERTERTEHRYEETFDLYLWALLPGLAFYALAWLSQATWARRLA
jgi:Ca-activated chloride channel family protein